MSVEKVDEHKEQTPAAESLSSAGLADKDKPKTETVPPSKTEATTTTSTAAEAAQKKEKKNGTTRVNLKDNPHMQQVVYTSVPHAGIFAIVKRHSLFELPRVLDEKQPRTKYCVVPHSQRSVNHWGQRKLFLSEIEFLTLFHDGTKKLVVYAGAAPGTHIAMLAKMFPEMDFFLVDPAPFNVKSHEGFEVVNTFFTEETVAQLQARHANDGIPILFISDIRTADPKVLPKEEIEKAVAEDMKLQMDWVVALRPRAAMFKFRLPWSVGSTPYLKGDVYLPIWGRETTTETRLIVREEDDFAVVPYDNKLYEEQLFHFNRHTRVEYYDRGIYERVAQQVEMDHCYDCAAELVVLDRYARNVLHVTEEGKLREEVIKLVRMLNTACSPEGRTLKYKESAEARQGWFDAHKFDYDKRTLTVVAEATSKSHRYQRRDRDDDQKQSKEGTSFLKKKSPRMEDK